MTIVTFIRNATRMIIVSMRNHHAEAITRNLTELFAKERKRQKLSHQQLADKAGLHRSTISLIETGKRTPTILVCLKLSMALDVSLEALIRKATKL